VDLRRHHDSNIFDLRYLADARGAGFVIGIQGYIITLKPYHFSCRRHARIVSDEILGEQIKKILMDRPRPKKRRTGQPVPGKSKLCREIGCADKKSSLRGFWWG
jgi:hypothetical protein